MGYISSFLKRKFNPKKRGSYAILRGDFIGEIMIFINQSEDESFDFLLTPSFKNINIPLENFKNGLEQGILEYIEIVPKKHWEIFNEKFNKNKIENL